MSATSIRASSLQTCTFLNLRIYRNWRCHATCQQIVVKRGNLKLLIVNLQDNTGLCHYVISVRYKFEDMTPCNIAGTNVSKEDDFSSPCKLITLKKQVKIHQMTAAEKSNGHHTQTLILILRVLSLPNRDHVTNTWLWYTNKASHIDGTDKVWGNPSQKSIQTSLILRLHPSKPYELPTVFTISVIFIKIGKQSDFHLNYFQMVGP